MDDTVYPKQNPLNNIIPKTTGIPIIVVPASQIIIANPILLFIESISKSDLSKFSIVLNFSMNSFIYDITLVSCSSEQLFINITPINIPIKNTIMME